MNDQEIKNKVLGLVKDSVADLLYYDRKNSEEFPVGFIDEAVRDGKVTIQEMVQAFKKSLKKNLQ